MTALAGAGVREPKNLVGQYDPHSVDWIERYIVTEAMVDHAIIKSCRPSTRARAWGLEYQIVNPTRRAVARRNIALGIRAGAYAPYFS